ncbi:MAG: hypothetical protein U1E40_00455 [Amaricoccus sp.]
MIAGIGSRTVGAGGPAGRPGLSGRARDAGRRRPQPAAGPDLERESAPRPRAGARRPAADGFAEDPIALASPARAAAAARAFAAGNGYVTGLVVDRLA